MSNKAFSFYDLATGVFTGTVAIMSEAMLAANTPPGCGAYEGHVDAKRVRLDLATGALVAYTPPPPAAEHVAGRVRARRDGLLRLTDWMAIRAIESGRALEADVAAYRQALRDITQQPEFPHEVRWPTL